MLERYEFGPLIAAGGFGDIYRATQRSTGQDVAIKVLRLAHESESSARDLIERFHRETRLCAALQHPNIVRLIDSGEAAGGGVYAVFEFVRGSNLADVLAAEGALEPAEALHLMGQTLDALACAHAEGVIHRDLKPANIMVADTGARRNALVLDFGIGTFTGGARFSDLPRVTQRGEYLGTPAYSAPEQLRGEPSSPATDLYAWGLITAECLTGEPALDGPLPQVIHRQFGPDPIPIPAALLDLELGRILAAVTEKQVARREGSAKRVLAELEKAIAAGPLPTREELARKSDVTIARPRRALSELSRIWLVPLRRNPNFTGRQALLEELRTSLQRRGLLAIAALRGLGGVGKTQMALEYAYRYGGEYDLVAWLRAGEPESLAQDFAALAEALDLPERESPDQRQMMDAVRAWLERNSNWLVIFDNAPNPGSLRKFLPRTASGHILVTSRHQSWRELGRSVDVEELGLEEAVEFLLARTGESDHEGAIQLAQELGRLPLALENAAAYIESTGRSIESYLPLLRDQQKVLLSAPALPDYPENLRGAWEISFRQVEEEMQEAADLLRLCAFLAPDDVPFGLLNAGGSQLPPALEAAARDPVRFDQCVAALRRYSLVKVEGDSLSMHRMVQLVTRERLEPAAKDEWAERALRFAEANFPDSGLAGDFDPATGRLLPHALAALSHTKSLRSCAIPAGLILNRSGNYLSARGHHSEARKHLERAVRLFEQASEPREIDVARVSADLGLVLFAAGELSQARASIERAVEIHEREQLGASEFHVAADLIKLAWVLRAEGDLERVQSCSEQAIAKLEHVMGSNHPLVAMALSTYCRALFGLGEFDAARAGADRALEILGNRSLYHPLMCSCWYSLGQVQLDFGDFDRAGDCVERALEIGDRAYGSDHPLTAASMVARGVIQSRRGLLLDAKTSFEAALAGAERACHRLHEDIAIARSQLGDVLRRLGQREEAEQKLLHAAGEMDRVCGERSRFKSHVEGAFAALRAEGGDLDAARVHAQRSLDALDPRYGPDHPYRIPVLNLQANIERAAGATERACELARRALALGDAALGGAHPDLADTHMLLASVAAEACDREAEQLHRSRAEQCKTA